MENENTQVLNDFKKTLVQHPERDQLAEKISFAHTWLEEDRQSCIVGLKQMIDDLVGEASFLYTTNRGADALYMEKLCLAKTLVNDWGYLFKELPEHLDFFAQASDFLLNIFSRTQLCDLTKLEIRIHPDQTDTQHDTISLARESLEKILKVCDFNKDLLSYDVVFGQKLQIISDLCQTKIDRINEYVQTKSNNPNPDNDEFQQDLLMLKELKNFMLLSESDKIVFIQELDAELNFHLENLASGIQEETYLGSNSLGSITDFLTCVLDYLFYLKDTEKELEDLTSWLTKLKAYLEPASFSSLDHLLKTNDQQQLYVEEIALLLLLNNLESLNNLMPIFIEFEQISESLDVFYNHFAEIGTVVLSKLKDKEILVLQNFPDETGAAPNTFSSYDAFLTNNTETESSI